MYPTCFESRVGVPGGTGGAGRIENPAGTWPLKDRAAHACTVLSTAQTPHSTKLLCVILLT